MAFSESTTVFSWIFPILAYLGFTRSPTVTQASSSQALAVSAPHLFLIASYQDPAMISHAHCHSAMSLRRKLLEKSSNFRLGSNGPLRSSNSFILLSFIMNFLISLIMNQALSLP